MGKKLWGKEGERNFCGSAKVIVEILQYSQALLNIKAPVANSCIMQREISELIVFVAFSMQPH